MERSPPSLERIEEPNLDKSIDEQMVHSEPPTIEIELPIAADHPCKLDRPRHRLSISVVWFPRIRLFADVWTCQLVDVGFVDIGHGCEVL